MILYATTTSERASKGQGGEYLNILITGEGKQTLMEIRAKLVNNDYIIDGYAIHEREDKKRSEQYFRYEITKKSETMECEKCGEIIPITRDIKGFIVSEDCPFCP